jgi:hypothetical protein
VIVRFAVLAFVLACAAAYVFSGGSFDTGRFVTAVPIAAIAVLVLVSVARLFSGAPRPVISGPRITRRGNPMVGMVLGAVGLTVAGVMAVSADNAMRSYLAEPSCRAGFAADPGAGGRCRLVPVRIVRAYHTGRHNSYATLDLEFPDGSVRRAVVGQNVNGALWIAARNGTSLEATAQLDGPSVVQLQSAAGTIQTDQYPQNQLRQWTFIGLVAGGFGLISALGILLRGIV